MQEAPAFKRYEHQRIVAVRNNYSDTTSATKYVASGPRSERDRRIASALNGIFTSLTESFADIISADSPADIFFPSQVLGRISERKPYPPKDFPVFRSIKSEFIREFEEYIELEAHGIPGPIFRIPIGTYGEPVARAIVQTQQVLISLLAEKVKTECGIEDARNLKLLKHETFHGNTLRTMQEGVQTTGTAFALLTGEGFEGYEDEPVGLFREIAESDAVRQLSAFAPFGKIVPAANRGYGFVQPLARTDKGISLSHNVIQLMSLERRVDPHPSRPSERQQGCPVSYKNTPLISPSGDHYIVPDSGVTTMTHMFVSYFENIYAQYK